MTYGTLAGVVLLGVFSQTASMPDPYPAATERAFVDGVQKDLMQRFPTVGDALKAGYFRYTNVEAGGSISYVNLRWQSSDPQHPSQLWYDFYGDLLGADFSVLARDSNTAPALWGVQSARWSFSRAHIDYILEAQDADAYGLVSLEKFVAAGGNTGSPSAETLAKLGVVITAGDVNRIFLFPALWDLSVWVKPNPNGAFARSNPLVTSRPDSSDAQRNI